MTDAPEGQPPLLAHTTFNDAVFPVTVNEPIDGADVTEATLSPEPVWLPTMGLPTTVVRVALSCTPMRAAQLLGARIELDVKAELTDAFSGAAVYPRSPRRFNRPRSVPAHCRSRRASPCPHSYSATPASLNSVCVRKPRQTTTMRRELAFASAAMSSHGAPVLGEYSRASIGRRRGEHQPA